MDRLWAMKLDDIYADIGENADLSSRTDVSNSKGANERSNQALSA